MTRAVENPGSKTKHAIADAADIKAILAAARSRSQEHGAVVTILLWTGMHISVLTRIGTSNMMGDVLWWERPKKAPIYKCSNCSRLRQARGGPPETPCTRCGGTAWGKAKSMPGRVCRVRVKHEDFKAAVEYFLPRPKKSATWYAQLVKEAAVDAGMPWVSAMTFRKTRAWQLRRAGLSIEEVANALGCSQRLIVETYALLSSDDLLDAIASADGIPVDPPAPTRAPDPQTPSA